MKGTGDFTITHVTSASPRKVFEAIQNVRHWWSGYYAETIEGGTEKLNDEFTFLAGGGEHFSRQRLIEVIPDTRITWLVTESKLNFLEKKDEWTGTHIVFEISRVGEETHFTFTHKGLTQEVECFDSCAPAWTLYLQNRLFPLINSMAS